jgi:hypothetical protein
MTQSQECPTWHTQDRGRDGKAITVGTIIIIIIIIIIIVIRMITRIK